MRFLRRREVPPDPDAAYLVLRGLPLGDHGGPTDPFEGTQIIAVVLDWGQQGGSATIAAMADGATSLYTSTGGGIIGGGFHAPVREAHRRLMQTAEEHLEAFAPATDAPIPVEGRLAIVIRTAEGLRRAEVSLAELVAGVAPGQAVFEAANDVTTALRLTGEAMERRQEQARGT